MIRQSRYPELKRGPDGRKRCRGCGGPIPPRKDGKEDRRKTWCSPACYDKYAPDRVFARVHRRAGNRCERCHRLFCEIKEGGGEYHHIVPVSEGGVTTDENIQLICEPCHREVTRQWHRDRADQRKGLARRPGLE